MLNDRAISGVLGAWALASHLPTANAFLSWDLCSKNAEGKTFCKDRVPKGARIAIAIVCLMIIMLLLTLCFCIVRNRRTSAADKEYNVEASQMQGPPTIIATAYNPRSGPSPVYSHSGHFEIGHLSPMTPQMSGPALPATAHYHYNNNNNNNDWKNPPPEYMNQTHTAPVTKVYFPDQPYPFGAPSPQGLSPPKTAFGYGFPRPLLAGNRLKDRLKERPASVSATASSGEAAAAAAGGLR